jgi:serine/threonine protein kinase
MGLILDHELSPERFYYVMRYVPGQSLRIVTSRLHAASGGQGLEGESLRTALGYVRDLLRTLREYHAAGMWHKDVKPDNVIVEEPKEWHTPVDLRASILAPLETPRHACLVDFGLLSSLRSAMTLTTHGTEYYRDPEMVRQALRGVKVHEVDGVRFDIYATGAVMYSVLEDAFPAQGVLSPFKKRVPAAATWIVRRAMADYEQRYTSVDAMLQDMDALLASGDLFAFSPMSLPSNAATRDALQDPAPANALPAAQSLLAAHADASALGATAGLPVEPSAHSWSEHSSNEPLEAPPTRQIPQPLFDASMAHEPTRAGGAPTSVLAATAGAPLPRCVVVTNWWSGAIRMETPLPASSMQPAPAPASQETPGATPEAI